MLRTNLLGKSQMYFLCDTLNIGTFPCNTTNVEMSVEEVHVPYRLIFKTMVFYFNLEFSITFK